MQPIVEPNHHQDIALAWAGKMPIPEFSRGAPPPKRSTLVADLIDLWNSNFFITRRVEVVLFKGRERRSGANAGVVDYNLPGLRPDTSDSSSSSDSGSESDRYAGYGRGVDLTESRRRHKEEKKRRKKEKRLRKKAKELERAYTLYLAYVHPRDLPSAQHGYYA